VSACPWCRESLPGFKAPPACPKCGKSLVDSTGATLRPLDIDFEAILLDADATSSKWVKRGAIYALVLGALAIVPFLAPFALFLLLVSQLFWGRFLIARRYTKHFSPVRRFTTRWMARLAVLVVMPWLYATLFIPFLGVVTAPAIFTGINWGLRTYFRFHFLRENRREGVTFVEKIFLVLFAMLFVLMLVLFALIAWGVLSLPGLSK
jgi:hypothetical protein